ncbi:MAG: hypothetical protein Q9227_006644 [Pyrenula ochraceoflavens]
MAAEPKASISILGSLSPWSGSRNSTPPPSASSEGHEKDEKLQNRGALDHSVTFKSSIPSFSRYPRDCPPLKTRWYYAVDVPKRKPLAIEKDEPPQGKDAQKAKQTPKKYVPFSNSDSQSIENAFQTLAERQNSSREDTNTRDDNVKVPVNEDYLYDVSVTKRELEPAYWLGPVYEVRRGSWFYVEGSSLRPAEENLANQLEEGYLKLRPWKLPPSQAIRSSSQPRSRPASMSLAPPGAEPLPKSETATPKLVAHDAKDGKVEPIKPLTYRLFGTYMNSIVTYQDSSTAWLSSDDLMSWMSSTVYQRFGAVGGTKLIRGYSELKKPEVKPTEGAQSELSKSESLKRRSAPPGTFTPSSASEDASHNVDNKVSAEQEEQTRTTLERQISSIAGGGDTGDSEALAEEARLQEEQEMEEARKIEGEDQGRQIEHLVLVTHGIGQKLGMRYDSINFIHDVNTLRKTMKAVYNSAPDLQALNSQFEDMPKNCRVQVLPVCWRHLLDFPRQSLRQNRKERDLTDFGADDEDYPSLADISMGENGGVRNLISDLALDILLYQSAYREHIATIVQEECNRLYRLFKERNPSFSGRVSLCGHSLGSAIVFDILCRQKDSPTSASLRLPEKHGRIGILPKEKERDAELTLNFDCHSFFCLGSPIAIFQMLKGRTIAARRMEDATVAESPFDPVPKEDPLNSDISASRPRRNSHILPISVSSPKCAELFNIFHPADPIAHRIEPLISTAMTDLKPQPLPLTKKGLFDAPGFSHIGARVGQSVGSMWYNLRSGVANSLLNRSLGLSTEDYGIPDTKRHATNSIPPGSSAPERTGSQLSDGKKQQELAEKTLKRAASSPDDMDNLSGTTSAQKQTLIDSELETLYAGFQKGQFEHQAQDPPTTTEAEKDEDNEERKEQARRYRREEAKVRALNSNGRVDYSVQESMVGTLNPLSSIASHLTYWADEDVNHFMVSQLLSKAEGKGGGGR